MLPVEVILPVARFGVNVLVGGDLVRCYFLVLFDVDSHVTV